ncbi:MAG: hypothetical protein LUD83_08360 [Clostridiales bacterium]|nr:hypothetical protein [Clostridiales bacterium]
MRLQLNLNQYYDGLEDYQVNTLFGLFADVKPRIDFLQDLIEDGKAGTSFFRTCRATSFSGFREIDEFMQSVGKEPIFDIMKSLSDANMQFDAVPVQPLIERFYFLMSEPQPADGPAQR